MNKPPLSWQRLRLVIAATAAAATTIGLAPAATAAAPSNAPTKCSLATAVSIRDTTPPSCFRAHVSLERLPAVGDTATVRVKVDSQVAAGRVDFTVRVTESLEILAAGSALGAPQADGGWSKATGTVSLPVGSKTLTFQVRARAEGPAQVEAGVNDAAVNSPEHSAFDSTQVTVGKGSSRAGADFTSLPGKAATSRGVSNPKAQQSPPPAKTKYQVALAPAGQICVNGGFQYTYSGVTHNVANAKISIHGLRTANSAWEVVATGQTAATSYLRLRDADPDSEHLVLHEASHAFHHRLYNFWWPNPTCGTHQIHVASNMGCAWTEGFANALAGYIKGDDRFVWPDGSWISLMNTTWFNSSYAVSSTNWNDGDAVEGRAAGSMINLWRNADGGPNSTITLLSYYTQSTFFEYFNDRGHQNLDLTSASRTRLYSHTIDYRQVLGNNGFESGAVTWSWSAPGTDNVIGTWSTYAPRTGTWYAWLGGYGYDTTTSLTQGAGTPAAPSGKDGKVTLSFWSRIWSEEAVGADPYDILQIQVVDGATVTSVAPQLSNQSRSNGYVFRTYDLSAWRGRNVSLRFMADEDATMRTDFIIDDVQVTYNQN